MTTQDYFLGKRVAVIGAHGAIASIICEKLHAYGVNLIEVSRSGHARIGNQGMSCDLSDAAEVRDLAAELSLNCPDILINIAGVQYCGLMEQQHTAQITQTFDVNLIAPIIVSSGVLTAMIQRKSGHIVNVGSGFGSVPYPFFATYSASKAGLAAFSQSLRRETNRSNISVTHVSPRAVETELNGGTARIVGRATDMAMDDPNFVADQILMAIAKRKKSHAIGRKERFFGMLNTLLPDLVDFGLKGPTQRARMALSGQDKA